MEFVRTEVDRVPAIWAPDEAELQAGLVIRVGSADETLVRHGITHLVEHLVLHRLGQTDYHFNGAVGQLTTTFYTQGGPDEVAHFFGAVCRALRDLPMDRLATEKGILRTEWSGRGRPVSEPLSRWRYGPAAHNVFAMVFSLAGDRYAAARQFDAIGELATEFPWNYLESDPAGQFESWRSKALTNRGWAAR